MARTSLPRTEYAEKQGDSNPAIIIPKTAERKEEERKAKLLQELTSQSESKWSSKKKKRLEKCIDKKLKKEERLLLFDKLATGKLSTFNERQEKAEDALIRKAMTGQVRKRKRHQDVHAVEDASSDEGDDEDEETRPTKQGRLEFNKAEGHPANSIVVVEAPPNPQPRTASETLVGSALHRNPDGSIALPKVRLKKTIKSSFQRGWGKPGKSVVEAETDTSFDSSDSENDVSEENEDGPKSEGSHSDHASNKESKPACPTKKSSGFKDWALKQLNAAKGYVPSPISEHTDMILQPTAPPKGKVACVQDGPREMRGPLGEDFTIPFTSFSDNWLNSKDCLPGTAYVKPIAIERPADVEQARLFLPIVTEEQPVMEAILLNPVIIICGETGSGKTTQVPQFLYETGFGTPGSDNPGVIGITQPRRVAAMSMAGRVGHELSLTSSRVSYQIRYDATISPTTSIKFMTDGVLLRELATDFLLTKYSVIIVDEAHERSINTDIVIGVLSRVIKLREKMWKAEKGNVKPLRLIIMSATLRVSDFSENKNLFDTPPPVINVTARQHPVTIHFSRRTYPDYVTQAIKKTIKIHTRLPPGGILIFLTGQAEIAGVCRRLQAKFSEKAIQVKKQKKLNAQKRLEDEIEDENLYFTAKHVVASAQADVEVEDIELGNIIEDELALDVDKNMDADRDSGGFENDDDDALDNELAFEEGVDVPMYIVPLYSLPPSENQMLVFKPPPPGCRLVVVSTNIAETSLTIPGIRSATLLIVGELKNGIQSFRVSWIAKSSAAQRAGRAGRTGPGHCYRLYSSALYEHHFKKFSTPEIQRMPVEGVVLQMKSMHIDAVINFPFPTPPDRYALQKAEKSLMHLGALSPITASQKEGQITNLGRSMSLFPLSPRFSRMLVSGQQHGCLPYIICLVSAMSVGDPFIYEEALELDRSSNSGEIESDVSNLNSAQVQRARQNLRKEFFKSQHVHCSLGNYTSDLFKVLSIVGAYEYAGGGQQFCAEHFVRPKAMEEIHKLRAQLSAIVQANFLGTDLGFINHLPPPTDHQQVLRQLLTAGFIDQVAVRKDLIERSQASGTQYSMTKGIPYQAFGVQEDVYIHPSSLLIGGPPPDYICYHEIIRASRVYLKGVTVVNPNWLSSLGKETLCTFSKPIPNNVGTLMAIPRFGPQGWELPAIKAE